MSREVLFFDERLVGTGYEASLRTQRSGSVRKSRTSCCRRRGKPARLSADVSGVRMKRLILSLTLAMSLSVSAGEPSATAKREISHLISHLAKSECQFNRNGKWYDASRAVSHLDRKYEYLLKRDLVPTAEAFIERAASESLLFVF